jgi:threonylcarbamoyladenosine tRNA methylthiotransferase MtaB
MKNMPQRTCRLITLGCKVNQYETQYVKEALEANGYREAAAGEHADLCIVNTCTVTHEADAKGRQAIRRLALANPGAAVVVMGCFATRDPEAVARLPGVTQVVTDKALLAQELRRHGVERMPAGISRFDGHQRVFVKVQDGCLLNCSYCIIPSVRPRLASRSIGEIEDEVAALVDRGCREIVLTGIHLGHYGIDLCKGKPKSQWQRLPQLLERLCRLGGDFRIRLSSLEAAEVRDDLIETMAAQPRVCPHLHLCLQSGSDRILQAMKRRYRSRSFLERCDQLRHAFDQPALTTDVIVGFPDETEADFEETCAVVRAAAFCKIHIFTFSPRKGTPAAGLPNRIEPRIVEERRRRLLALEGELAERFCRSLIGKRMRVLVEASPAIHDRHVRGTSCRHVPVELAGFGPALLGKCVDVRIADWQRGVLIGDPVPDDENEFGLSPAPLSERGRRLALPLLASI